ncbi:MAG: hypothetical protein JNM42_17475 [Propionivibrio sp.]|uniref:hypothetical protein n=1 Tax=Propionivibrio sp. TaxID=2212460 RepID=UPI001A4307D4|nr:hypothetical protein [Propionivibrio sp.]MBL8416222.1 hypothetical protein [Propionivibrio sp.]
MTRAQRPQLTLKIMFYAIFDVVGMVSFASGALWFAQGQSLFIPDFPSSMAGALAAIIAGLLLMLWAAAQILRELIKRPVNVVEEGK